MITKYQNLTFSGLIQNGVKSYILKFKMLKKIFTYKPKTKLEKKIKLKNFVAVPK